MSILALRRKQKKREKRRKFLIKRIGRKQKKERKFPIKEWEKAKKKENCRSNIGRKQKKYAERSLDQTTSEQYMNCHQVNKKRKETTT